MSATREILVVDDDAEIRDLTRSVLAGEGHDVVGAASGSEAIDLARARAFHLVLLDINMPGMDGWETLRLMRSDASLRDLPVVMFSVKSEFRDRIHGIQEGAIDYIRKPFQVDELLSRVRRIFDTLERGGKPRPAPAPQR